MTSPARIAANQKNAQKSTGPKSAEGKSRASLNALKHGLTAETVVLPGENAEAFDERLAMWRDAYGADDPARATIIERAVISTWRLDRCARAERAGLTARGRHAALDAARAAAIQAEELGARLVFEPVDRVAGYDPRDERMRDRIQRREDEIPAVLVRELNATAAGVDWLLARWENLAGVLETFRYWNVVEKFKALRMLGREPERVLEDPVVARVFAACMAANPDPRHVYDEVRQATGATTIRDIDERRLEALRVSVPEDPEVGLAHLKATVEREVADLRRLKSEALDSAAALDLESAAGAACFDGSPAAALLRRYESSCERELHRAVAELRRGVIPAIHGEEETEAETEEERQEGEGVTNDREATPGPDPSPGEPPVGFVPPQEEASGPAALAPAPLPSVTPVPVRSEAVEAAPLFRTKLVQG
jgi:hypothetical protein